MTKGAGWFQLQFLQQIHRSCKSRVYVQMPLIKITQAMSECSFQSAQGEEEMIWMCLCCVLSFRQEIERLNSEIGVPGKAGFWSQLSWQSHEGTVCPQTLGHSSCKKSPLLFLYSAPSLYVLILKGMCGSEFFFKFDYAQSNGTKHS